jgi:hypothetical protein
MFLVTYIIFSMLKYAALQDVSRKYSTAVHKIRKKVKNNLKNSKSTIKYQVIFRFNTTVHFGHNLQTLFL